MAVKMGIRTDYDLAANAEVSAQNNTCELCGASPVSYQWSDCPGEAMCTQCGCPYQLKWGTERQEKEGKYPYQNLSEKFLAVAREYWQEKKKFVCHGYVFGSNPVGLAEFVEWLKECHPEWL